MEKEIINWLDSDASWDDIIFEIKERCKIEDVEHIALKIVRDFGYRRQDPHVPNPSTTYCLTHDLYEDLDNLCQCEDNKSGCQLMQDEEGNYFFQITGQNFYDKENNYVGTDTVKIWFKEFLW